MHKITKEQRHTCKMGRKKAHPTEMLASEIGRMAAKRQGRRTRFAIVQNAREREREREKEMQKERRRAQDTVKTTD